MDKQELEAGLKCIAAAVQDQSGKIIATLSIADAALRFNRKRVANVSAFVSRMASDFSASLASPGVSNYAFSQTGLQKVALRAAEASTQEQDKMSLPSGMECR